MTRLAYQENMLIKILSNDFANAKFLYRSKFLFVYGKSMTRYE